MRRISAHYLWTPGGFLPGRVVAVDAAGTITDISAPGHLDREAGVEFYPGILIPGLVNAHSHLELSYMCGAIPPGGGFAGFAEGMRTRRGGFPDGDRLSAASFRDAKMWTDGVSAVADICNGATTFAVKGRSRIAYHSFIELFGLDADPARVFGIRDTARSGGLTATVTPHATYSLQREDFAAVLDGPNNLPLSIHFMESESETGLFEKRGPMWEWYAEQGLEPDFLDYGSPAERLAAQVPADRPVMLVHNCCVTQRDIDIVMGHFTAPVTWVLCPGSNRYISGLRPPVELLRKNRLRIAVGTDSLASNETLSMVRELGMLGNVPLEELLGWATLNGARALGMDDRLGSVEVGKTPGLVLLSGVDLQTMTLGPDPKTERIV